MLTFNLSINDVSLSFTQTMNMNTENERSQTRMSNVKPLVVINLCFYF